MITLNAALRLKASSVEEATEALNWLISRLGSQYKTDVIRSLGHPIKSRPGSGSVIWDTKLPKSKYYAEVTLTLHNENSLELTADCRTTPVKRLGQTDGFMLGAKAPTCQALKTAFKDRVIRMVNDKFSNSSDENRNAAKELLSKLKL